MTAGSLSAHAAPDAGAREPELAHGSVTAESPAVDPRRRPEGAVQASLEDELRARWNVGGNSDPAFVSNRAGFHVAPRILVDTVVTSGRLPASSSSSNSGRRRKTGLSQVGVLAQTRNRGYWPFRLCYEAGLRPAAKLKGKTHVRMVIGRNGKVTSSRLGSTELADRNVATCLVARTRTLRFSPAPERTAEVDVTVDLSPGDAPLPGSGIEREGIDEAPSGTLDLKAMGPALAGALAPAASCYEEGLARDRALWGRLGIRVEVNAEGTIRSVHEEESRFPDSRVAACVLASVADLRVLAPVGGATHFVWGLRFGSVPIAPVSSAAAVVHSAVSTPEGIRPPIDN
jgi:hypothetical protein